MLINASFGIPTMIVADNKMVGIASNDNCNVTIRDEIINIFITTSCNVVIALSGCTENEAVEKSSLVYLEKNC